MEERDQPQPDIAEPSGSQCDTAMYVKLIHQSIDKVLQQTTNDDFGRNMMSLLGTQNSRVFSERFAEGLIKLTSVVHHIDIEKSFLVDYDGGDEDDDAADPLDNPSVEPSTAASAAEEIELPAMSQTTINYLEEWLKFSQDD